MKRTPYQRTVEELEKLASKFWPPALSEKEAELSIIPKLLETQKGFVAILGVPVPDIDGLIRVVNESAFPGNLFLKHLVVLADVGGEMLNRINAEFNVYFPDGTLTYLWPNGKQRERREYIFNSLPVRRLDNNRLGLTGKRLLQPGPLTLLQQDVMALLLLGAACTDENVAAWLSKCELGEYIGQLEKLEKFIYQRYIWVSRITTGAQSNSLGQLAQQFVKEFVEEKLNVPEVICRSNAGIPGVQHTTDNRLTNFDLVISNGDKYVAVEVCFQVTTNSVIERKAGQAQARYKQLQAKSYKIAYVLDGAGNFERQSALRTICTYSHCTVAFSTQELEFLCQFVRAYFLVN